MFGTCDITYGKWCLDVQGIFLIHVLGLKEKTTLCYHVWTFVLKHLLWRFTYCSLSSWNSSYLLFLHFDWTGTSLYEASGWLLCKVCIYTFNMFKWMGSDKIYTGFPVYNGCFGRYYIGSFSIWTYVYITCCIYGILPIYTYLSCILPVVRTV